MWLTRPTSASSDSSRRASDGRTNSFGGPSLSDTVDLEYAEFYLTADVDGERYIDRYTPRTEFDSRAGAVADLHEGELELDWHSISGRDAFAEADRIEMSVYLYALGEGRTIISHEVVYP